MKEIYDTYFDSNYRRLSDQSKKGYDDNAKMYGAYYERFLPVNKDAKILDIGCGTGFFLYFLKKKGYTNYYGIDISKQQIEVCKEKITKDVELVDALDYLNDKNEIWDLIVMNDILEHIPKIKLMKFLKLVHNSLKQGGTVIVKVPNMANPLGLRSRYIDITHELGFTEDSLYEVLNATGFCNIGLHPTNYPVKSIKSFIGKTFQSIVHRGIRLLCYLQGYGMPKILTPNLIAVAKKQYH